MKALVAAALAAAVLGPTLAVAQQGAQQGTQEGQPPQRLDNIWNGKSHEPAPGAVRQREEAAGLRGSPAQQRSRDDEVNALDKQILERAQQGGNDGVMNGSAATAPLQ